MNFIEKPARTGDYIQLSSSSSSSSSLSPRSQSLKSKFEPFLKKRTKRRLSNPESNDPNYHHDILKPSPPSRAFQKSTLPLLSLPKVPQRSKKLGNNLKKKGIYKDAVHHTASALYFPERKEALNEVESRYIRNLKNQNLSPNHNQESKQCDHSDDKNYLFQASSELNEYRKVVSLERELIETEENNKILCRLNYDDDNYPTVTLPPEQAKKVKFAIGSQASIDHPGRGSITVTIETVSLDKRTFTPLYNVLEQRQRDDENIEVYNVRHKNIREDKLQIFEQDGQQSPIGSNNNQLIFSNKLITIESDKSPSQTESNEENNGPIPNGSFIDLSLNESPKKRLIDRSQILGGNKKLVKTQNKSKIQLKELLSNLTSNEKKMSVSINDMKPTSNTRQLLSSREEVSLSSSQRSLISSGTSNPPPYRKSSIRAKPLYIRKIEIKKGIPLKAVAHSISGPHGSTHQKLQVETNTRIKFFGDGFGLRDKTINYKNKTKLIENSKHLKKKSSFHENEKPYIQVSGDNEDKVMHALKKVADLIVAAVGVKYRDNLWRDLQISNPCLRVFTNEFNRKLKERLGLISQRSNTEDKAIVPNVVTFKESDESSQLTGSFSPIP